MSTEQLEQRVAAIEKTLADIQQQVAALVNGGQPKKWQPPGPRPMTPEDEEAFQYMVEFGRYYRKAGKEPPPDWKPGDPIPDPDPEWLS